MEKINLISITPEELQQMIKNAVTSAMEEFTAKSKHEKVKKFITRNEVCEMLNISLVTLNRYSKQGILKCLKIGGRILYEKKEVENAIEENLKFKTYRR